MQKYSLFTAELVGTYFLVFFGCGIVINVDQNLGMNANVIPLVWGGVVAAMIYAVGHISGAHFNPAVSLAFWVAKKISFAKLCYYTIAQCMGAIFASLSHAILWSDKSHSFGRTEISLGLAQGFTIEIILSFALMFVIISVATDERAVGELAGLAIGTTVALCAFVGGPLTGASMNPARSLGPALISGNLSTLWVYTFAPIIGTVLAVIVYRTIQCKAVSDSHTCC